MPKAVDPFTMLKDQIKQELLEEMKSSSDQWKPNTPLTRIMRENSRLMKCLPRYNDPQVTTAFSTIIRATMNVRHMSLLTIEQEKEAAEMVGLVLNVLAYYYRKF